MLRVYRDHAVGAAVVEVHATQARGQAVKTVALVGRGVFTVFGLRRDPGAVVHVHLSQGGSFLREGGILWVAWVCGIPSVATIHGSTFVPFAKQHAALAGRVLRRADVITCLSESAMAEIRNLAPSVAVSVVPNAVAGDDEAPPADQTEEVVLFGGEVSRRKGADVLMKAWERLLQERPNARCVVVGPLTDLDVPVLDRLEVLAPVSSAEMRGLMRQARVAALPSRNEGMPMFLTEALGAGRPFVSTPVGGVPELADGVQALVAVGDAEALADSIVMLLADPALARARGERGRQLYASTRSVAVIGVIMHNLYGQAIARSATRHSGSRGI